MFVHSLLTLISDGIQTMTSQTSIEFYCQNSKHEVEKQSQSRNQKLNSKQQFAKRVNSDFGDFREMFGRLLGCYTIYTFLGDLAPNGILPGAKFTSKSCILLYWQHQCTELQKCASAKLCSIEQRAPPIFGRAAITLGIGPRSGILMGSWDAVEPGTEAAGRHAEPRCSVQACCA